MRVKNIRDMGPDCEVFVEIARPMSAEDKSILDRLIARATQTNAKATIDGNPTMTLVVKDLSAKDAREWAKNDPNVEYDDEE